MVLGVIFTLTQTLAAVVLIDKFWQQHLNKRRKRRAARVGQAAGNDPAAQVINMEAVAAGVAE